MGAVPPTDRSRCELPDAHVTSFSPETATQSQNAEPSSAPETKDCPGGAFPGKGADGKYHPAVVLDLDYWLLMPRRA